MTAPNLNAAPLSVFLVVGEESGDQLGAALMRSLKALHGDTVRFAGVGGERMAAEGLASLFPLSDIAVMGLTAVLQRLPSIVRRVYETVDAVVAAQPDVLVIIDSPEFTHNVAKRVRKRAPGIPIVDYVSPSVWAWRSGRAGKMAAYVDHLLALLPFEPEVHRRLGGPPTTYVGHTVFERIDALHPAPGERPEISAAEAPVLLVLPGSRRNEIARLLDPFAAAVHRIASARSDIRFVLPAVGHLEGDIRAKVASWPVQPEVIGGEAAKFAAFRKAHAALAASGSVSLELAISGVPMVVAYKLDWFLRRVRDAQRLFRFSGVNSMVLPNIILEDKVVPEFLEEEVTPEALATAVLDLLADTPQRRRQIEAFGRLEDMMRLEDGESQSGKAARIVTEVARRGR